MKILLLSTVLLSGCHGFKTTFGVAYENKEGQRFEGSASFEETGKRPVRSSK